MMTLNGGKISIISRGDGDSELGTEDEHFHWFEKNKKLVSVSVMYLARTH